MFQITPEVLFEIKKFNRNCEWLRKRDKEEKKSHWVKASVIKKATGWDYEGMRKAREHGYVKYKKENGGFFYDLSSIHEIHHKK